MDHTLILAASLAYLVATLIFGVYLLRFSASVARAGVVVFALGTALTAGAVAARAIEGRLGGGTFDLLLVASAATAVGWLALRVRKPSPLLGAFLTPVLTMVLYSLHVYEYEASFVRTEVEWVTPVHKITSYIGFLVFAVAAAASVLQIVQEYRLKKRRLVIGPGKWLPSLPRLEAIAHRALVIGFPIYSVGLALGAIWLTRGATPITRHFVMATFSWVLYAAALHARLVIGLQGRRAAVLTLAAFVSALFVVVLSVLRAGG